MALFRRRRRAGEDTLGRRVVVTDELGAEDADVEEDYEEYDEADIAEPIADSPPLVPTDDEPVTARSETGPFDRSEVGDDRGGRLDLGGLWLGTAGGAELSIEVDQSTGGVQAVTTSYAGSAMQVQAFAAPRSSGIWRLVRQEIADSVTGRGGAADERPGPMGIELLTRLPSRGADGRTVYQVMRFVGVDGPRWFMRAVFTGPAASEEPAAEPFYAMLRDTVVLRGDEAMPPREMLPLRLPKELFEQPEQQDGDRPVRVDDLQPFERGPEITEIH